MPTSEPDPSKWLPRTRGQALSDWQAEGELVARITCRLCRQNAAAEVRRSFDDGVLLVRSLRGARGRTKEGSREPELVSDMVDELASWSGRYECRQHGVRYVDPADVAAAIATATGIVKLTA